FRSSLNDGIGVPLKPVLIVLKMSSRDDPPRNVQLCVRSAARIGYPKSSVSVGADRPSPRPSGPWHRMQPVSSKSFLPAAMVSVVDLGALGSSMGLGTLSLFENRGESVVMKYARSDTSWLERLGQAGIAL